MATHDHFKFYADKLGIKVQDEANPLGMQQWIFTFENGYGVSIIYGFGSYGFDEGKFELAVLCNDNKDLCYTTPITDNVLGHLSEAQIYSILVRIKALPRWFSTSI